MMINACRYHGESYSLAAGISLSVPHLPRSRPICVSRIEGRRHEHSIGRTQPHRGRLNPSHLDCPFSKLEMSIASIPKPPGPPPGPPPWPKPPPPPPGRLLIA